MPEEYFNKKDTDNSDDQKEALSKSWSNLGFSLALVSLIMSLCCCNIGGLPLSIFAGIFSLACTFIAKSIYNQFNKKNIISIVLAVSGIIFGFALFALFLVSFSNTQDPATANEIALRVQEMLKSLGVDADMNEIYNFYSPETTSKEALTKLLFLS